MKHVLLVNGPNLRTLGIREPEIYGTKTLSDIESEVKAVIDSKLRKLLAFQSDSEGALIEFLNEQFIEISKQTMKLAGIIINAGAYTHTSIAIRDALAMFAEYKVPIYEVHLSNVYARESFRHHSYVSSLATAVICGLGSDGYVAAARHIAELDLHAV